MVVKLKCAYPFGCHLGPRPVSILAMACKARTLDSNVTTFTTSVIFFCQSLRLFFGEVSIVLSKKADAGETEKARVKAACAL